MDTRDPTESGPPRQLVICCDGTNDTLTAGTNDTNVLRLVAHLEAHRSANRIIYYDPGVGSPDVAPPTDPIDWIHRIWQRVSGLASGRGVYENIALGYLFLMRNWCSKNDRIYCFGFSRGAFTARSIAGMVDLFGILSPAHEALLPTLMSIYFAQPSSARGMVKSATRLLHRVFKTRTAAHAPKALPTREQLGRQVRDLFAAPQGRNAWVHWIGVWDTVESVGVPGPLARKNPDTARVVEKRFRNVRHALSMDEHRWSFEPRLYEEHGGALLHEQNQTLKQRWFPGVHCDVGGGYRRAGSRLSDESLVWMISEVAEDLGVPRLAVPDGERLRHDSLWDTPWWAIGGMSLRDMQPKTSDGKRITVAAPPSQEAAAQSVWSVRRPFWPMALAAAAALLFLILAGACLRAGAIRMDRPDSWLACAAAACLFGWQQLAALWGAGTLQAGHAPWQVAAEPAAHLLCGTAFLVSWSYLLARACSRAFTWLAGARNPHSPMPWWRVFGMAPLLAVAGGCNAIAMGFLALAAHGAQADGLASVFLWLAAAGTAFQVLGLAACAPLLCVRCWIALPWVHGIGVVDTRWRFARPGRGARAAAS